MCIVICPVVPSQVIKNWPETLTMAPDFSIVDGLLYRHVIQKHPQVRERHLMQLAVPRLYVIRVLELNHDEITGGHIGINHLYAKMRLKYY